MCAYALGFSAEVGIVRLVVHGAKELDASKSMSGDLNPFAKVMLRNHEIHKTNVLKHTLTPIWESPKEFLVTDKASSVVTIKVGQHPPNYLLGF